MSWPKRDHRVHLYSGYQFGRHSVGQSGKTVCGLYLRCQDLTTVKKQVECSMCIDLDKIARRIGRRYNLSRNRHISWR